MTFGSFLAEGGFSLTHFPSPGDIGMFKLLRSSKVKEKRKVGKTA